MHSNYLELCILTYGIHLNLNHITIRKVSLHFAHLPQPFQFSNDSAQLPQLQRNDLMASSPTMHQHCPQQKFWPASVALKGSCIAASTRNLEQFWPCLAYSKHLTHS